MLHLKSTFSGVIQVANPMHPDAVTSGCEVLALYTSFHSLLLLGGLLNNLGLSFRTRWTVRPYLAFEQGFSHVQEIQPPA